MQEQVEQNNVGRGMTPHIQQIDESGYYENVGKVNDSEPIIDEQNVSESTKTLANMPISSDVPKSEADALLERLKQQSAIINHNMRARAYHKHVLNNSNHLQNALTAIIKILANGFDNSLETIENIQDVHLFTQEEINLLLAGKFGLHGRVLAYKIIAQLTHDRVMWSMKSEQRMRQEAQAVAGYCEGIIKKFEAQPPMRCDNLADVSRLSLQEAQKSNTEINAHLQE